MVELSNVKKAGSVGTLVFGVIFIIGAIVLFYLGSNRTDYSAIAEKAVDLSQSTSADDFVYSTGQIKSTEPMGDDLYFKNGDYLAIDRIAEMYAWQEDSETTSNDMTIYDYTKEWTESPEDSSSFDQDVYENPEMKVKSGQFRAGKGIINDYSVNIGKIRLPGLETVKLDENNVTLGNYETIEIFDGKTYIYDGYATISEPEIGSLRISYNVLPSGKTVTVFGKADGKEVIAHTGEKEKDLFRMFYGTKDDAVKVLKDEYNLWGWIFKILAGIAALGGLGSFAKGFTDKMKQRKVVEFSGGPGTPRMPGE